MGEVRVLRTPHPADHPAEGDEPDGREAPVLDITTGRPTSGPGDPDGGDAA